MVEASDRYRCCSEHGATVTLECITYVTKGLHPMRFSYGLYDMYPEPYGALLEVVPKFQGGQAS